MKAIVVAAAVLMSPSALAAPCFDFATPIKEPMRPPIPLGKGGKDASASGKLKTGKGVWAAARGTVPLPIADVYRRLLDHYTVKDPARVKLRTYEQEQPGYRDFHLVMVELKPAPMITLEWEENWGYLVAEGTAEAPRRVVISYQKTAGTKYIPHLCGSITLTANGGATDVALYEEIEAFGKRSNADTAKGHLGTLATLRSARTIAGAREP